MIWFVCLSDLLINCFIKAYVHISFKMGDYCLVIAFLELKNQLYRNLEFAFFYYAHGESEMLLG